MVLRSCLLVQLETTALYFLLLQGSMALVAPLMPAHQQLQQQQRHVSRTTPTHYSLNELSATRTLYTIDDSVCPPTRPQVLKASVIKACASLDTYLTRKPIATHTQQAFDSLINLLTTTTNKDELVATTKTRRTKRIVLDSGCGTGRSTLLLADMYPNHTVIGVDRSFARLAKSSSTNQKTNHDTPSIPSNDDNGNDEDEGEDEEESKRPFCSQVASNAFLVRAELVDFWRLLECSPLQVEHHFLLYPNPYPTQTRITQRWYGHPAFPLLVRLSSHSLTVRSNWKGYLLEFATAVQLAQEYYESGENGSPFMACVTTDGVLERTDKRLAWTNFEQKYDKVGEPTYELKLFNSLYNRKCQYATLL